MKRETLKELGLEEDAINQIMKMYGESVNKNKNEIDELNSKLDKLNNELSSAKQAEVELEKIKKDNMTKEELLEQKLKEAELRNSELAKTKNALDARSLLIEAGITDNLDSLVSSIVREDTESTMAGAKLIADTFKAKIEETAKKTKEEMSNIDLKPGTSDANQPSGQKEITKEELFSMTLEKQKAFKDENPDAYAKLTTKE